MKYRNFTATAISAGVLLAVLPLFAFAVEYGGIGGRPANPKADNPRTESIFIHTLDAGKSVEDGVRVINNTAEKKTLQIYAVDSVVSSGGAFACAQMAEEKKDVGSWIAMGKEEITLDSLTNDVVPFTIKAPDNASVGEHNGCIIIQEKKEAPKEKQSGIVLGFRTGLRVAILVPGEIVRKLEMAGFNVTSKKNGNFLLQPKVKNTGNVSIDADVKVLISYFFGKTYNQNGGQYPVLRGETSEWNFELKKPFWGGWYKTVAVVSYDANAEAGVGVKSGKALTTLESQPVWFFSAPTPTGMVVEIVIVLFALFLLFLLYIHLKRRSWIKHHWISYEVKGGEDLKGLADRFDISWKLLAKANRLAAPYILKAGDKLRVPPEK